MINDMLHHTKYEDIEVVSDVATAEWDLSNNFRTYFKEMLQNYKRIAGYIYSASDLSKLNIEERPKFVYNLFLPIILQLSGNFLNNQSRVEALPRTPGDFKMSIIMTDLLDYVHYTANDLRKELATAFVNAIIGRVGWIAQDWSVRNDSQGMMDIASWDPFRVMWELGFTRRNMKDCNYIVNRGWYSPEEIRSMYGMNDDDLWDEITEKAKLYMGTGRERNKKLVPYLQRTFGAEFNSYKGSEQGYDEITTQLDGMLYNNGNYYDGAAGLFKVIEFHERRNDKFWTIYDPNSGRKYDISKAIDAAKDGQTYDKAKLSHIREKFMQRGLDPFVQKEVISQIYQTAVCPAFNIKLYEAPYEVQNGNFKLTPIFCFDFGGDSMDWKSYIDHINDPVQSFNLEMNTMQTYLMKSSHGNTIAEEGSFGEFEDSWMENKIGDIKYVKAGYWDKWKKDEPPNLPVGLFQMSQIKRDLLKEISGIKDNSLGSQESKNESGKLFGLRVQQSDLLQTYIQDNAVNQMKNIGENSKDYMLHYMNPGRAVRIVEDESNPYWMEINKEAITKLFVDDKGEVKESEYLPGNFFEGKYDIILSKAPFGEAAKEREFAELMTLTQAALEMGRPDYVKFEYLVGNSRLRKKEEWINHIRQADESRAQAEQQAGAAQGEQLAGEAEKLKLENAEKMVDIKDKTQEAEAEKLLQESVLDALAQ